jgi:ABC-2 type transport system ATP-binding protein
LCPLKQSSRGEITMYKVSNLKKSYGKKADLVLKDISFDINEGEILGILGINGAGKTTLIKILLRALEPSGGKIEFLGNDLSKIPLSTYYKDVSAVLEGERNAYWYLTGFQNIQYFGRLKKLRDSVISEEADTLLKAFDLYDAKDQTAGKYSRGMLQKLSIIVAMLGDPKVLFLDEPTLGLDLLTKKAVMNNLKRLAEEKKNTIVLTSHELDVIDAVTDRVLVLENGGIAYVGKTSDFKQMYSENKYKLTVRGTVARGDILSDDCAVEERGATTDIILSNISNQDIDRLLMHILEKGYEIIAFSKDSNRLEDVMEAFIQRGSNRDA